MPLLEANEDQWQAEASSPAAARASNTLPSGQEKTDANKGQNDSQQEHNQGENKEVKQDSAIDLTREADPNSTDDGAMDLTERADPTITDDGVIDLTGETNPNEINRYSSKELTRVSKGIPPKKEDIMENHPVLGDGAVSFEQVPLEKYEEDIGDNTDKEDVIDEDGKKPRDSTDRAYGGVGSDM
ncbi:MAG: hypothetical protein Q9163_005224 [Psora crenata]